MVENNLGNSITGKVWFLIKTIKDTLIWIIKLPIRILQILISPILSPKAKNLTIDSNNNHIPEDNNNRTLLVIEDDWERPHRSVLQDLEGKHNTHIFTFNSRETIKDITDRINQLTQLNSYDNIAILAHGSLLNNINKFIAFPNSTSVDIIKKLKEAAEAKHVIVSSCYAGATLANKYKEDVIKEDNSQSITVIGEDREQVVIENSIHALSTLLAKSNNANLTKLDIAKEVTKNNGLDVNFIQGEETINTSIDRMQFFNSILFSFGIINKEANNAIELYNTGDREKGKSDFIAKLLQDQEKFETRNNNRNFDTLLSYLLDENCSYQIKEKLLLMNVILTSKIEKNIQSIIRKCIDLSYKEEEKFNKEYMCNNLLVHLSTCFSEEENREQSARINQIIGTLIGNTYELNGQEENTADQILSNVLNISNADIEFINTKIQNNNIQSIIRECIGSSYKKEKKFNKQDICNNLLICLSDCSSAKRDEESEKINKTTGILIDNAYKLNEQEENTADQILKKILAYVPKVNIELINTKIQENEKIDTNLDILERLPQDIGIVCKHIKNKSTGLEIMKVNEGIDATASCTIASYAFFRYLGGDTILRGIANDILEKIAFEAMPAIMDRNTSNHLMITSSEHLNQSPRSLL